MRINCAARWPRTRFALRACVSWSKWDVTRSSTVPGIARTVGGTLDAGVARELVAKGLYVSPVIGAGDHAGYLAANPGVSAQDHEVVDRPNEEDFLIRLPETHGFVHTQARETLYRNHRRIRELGGQFIGGSDSGAGMTRFQDM